MYFLMDVYYSEDWRLLLTGLNTYCSQDDIELGVSELTNKAIEVVWYTLGSYFLLFFAYPMTSVALFVRS